uniref:hypothetical protein n=1 Tax=Gorillibacterium sp. sgz5001074 TaxID=3446695 RepID=UPI003F67A1F6
MNILYNGVDITSAVQPTVLQLTDHATGKPDSLSVVFADPDGLWSQWKPRKNDLLQVRTGSFDTGAMFIDHLEQGAGEFAMKAL